MREDFLGEMIFKLRTKVGVEKNIRGKYQQLAHWVGSRGVGMCMCAKVEG